MLALGTCANSTDRGHGKVAVKVEVKVSWVSPLTSRITRGYMNRCPITVSSSLTIKSTIFHNYRNNNNNNNYELFNQQDQRDVREERYR